MDRMKELLAEKFGYTQFRSGQKEIIQKVLQKENVLGIMPTGGGKSICYQLPALVLEGVDARHFSLDFLDEGSGRQFE